MRRRYPMAFALGALCFAVLVILGAFSLLSVATITESLHQAAVHFERQTEFGDVTWS